MPIYDYSCQECDNVLEVFVMGYKDDEEPEIKCPECGSTNFKRLVSKTNFKLKGRGWFEDGYSKGKDDG